MRAHHRHHAKVEQALSAEEQKDLIFVRLPCASSDVFFEIRAPVDIPENSVLPMDRLLWLLDPAARAARAHFTTPWLV